MSKFLLFLLFITTINFNNIFANDFIVTNASKKGLNYLVKDGDCNRTGSNCGGGWGILNPDSSSTTDMGCGSPGFVEVTFLDGSKAPPRWCSGKAPQFSEFIISCDEKNNCKIENKEFFEVNDKGEKKPSAEKFKKRKMEIQAKVDAIKKEKEEKVEDLPYLGGKNYYKKYTPAGIGLNCYSGNTLDAATYECNCGDIYCNDRKHYDNSISLETGDRYQNSNLLPAGQTAIAQKVFNELADKFKEQQSKKK